MPARRLLLVVFALAALLAAAAAVLYIYQTQIGSAVAQPAVAAPAIGQTSADGELSSDLAAVLARYRKIIVLLADETSLTEADRQRNETVGQALFHEKIELESKLEERVAVTLATAGADRFKQLADALDYIESGPDLYDADRLAFREILQALRTSVAANSSLTAVKLHKRIGEDLDALSEIERQYDKEISQIFNRFENRAIALKREKWDDYVAHLKSLYAREEVLKDYGIIVPYTLSQLPPEGGEGEIFGTELPLKTVALTFDDGPHPQYTEEVAAILKQYGVAGTFFQVGRNLGTLDEKGQARLRKNAEVSRKLIGDGFAVGNHSFSHASLANETGEALKAEITNTDLLLQTVDSRRAPIFRFPYGARNAEAMQILRAAHLRPVLWNLDSLDWADPVPNSIADRVLRSVDKEGHGIILFHDIHERTVKALPLILDRMVADGYKFASWDGNGFSAKTGGDAVARGSVTTGYASSWAIVIGINDYAKWPKLHYAVNDATAVHQALIERFGFNSDHVLLLKDGEATRARILASFQDQLWHDKLQRNDRVFVFYAGHGATRRLSSGRDLGYIIPVDADPNETATDAIPMTEIQNIAESLDAKHVFFVMDACYSGLGLSRGGGGYLRENARRIGRQMLTAGGADQLVADGGPDGHSIFTWALLQGLGGKADLNGDGLITATELAAYIAPAVSNVSAQTPAFGSLPGSQGGDFVFELPAETEFLNTGSTQLNSAAIALNTKFDAARLAGAPTTPNKAPDVAPVKIKDLQGAEQLLKPPPTVNQSTRQRAQRANDRGLQLYKEKHYVEAEAAFSEALKLRPDFALAANNLGFIYFKQDKFAEAARWFENTIKLDPSRAIAYLNLGDAYSHVGDSKQAAKAYRTYLELAPSGAEADHVRKQLEQL